MTDFQFEQYLGRQQPNPNNNIILEGRDAISPTNQAEFQHIISGQPSSNINVQAGFPQHSVGENGFQQFDESWEVPPVGENLQSYFRHIISQSLAHFEQRINSVVMDKLQELQTKVAMLEDGYIEFKHFKQQFLRSNVNMLVYPQSTSRSSLAESQQSINTSFNNLPQQKSSQPTKAPTRNKGIAVYPLKKGATQQTKRNQRPISPSRGYVPFSNKPVVRIERLSVHSGGKQTESAVLKQDKSQKTRSKQKQYSSMSSNEYESGVIATSMPQSPDSQGIQNPAQSNKHSKELLDKDNSPAQLYFEGSGPKQNEKIAQ